MTGPCLCGDPYCGSCGNPSAAKFEDWMDRFMEKISDKGLSEDECHFLESIFDPLIDNYRKAIEIPLKEAHQNNLEYTNWAEAEMSDLRQKNRDLIHGKGVFIGGEEESLTTRGGSNENV